MQVRVLLGALDNVHQRPALPGVVAAVAQRQEAAVSNTARLQVRLLPAAFGKEDYMSSTDGSSTHGGLA
jgi:hypothetical protein